MSTFAPAITLSEAMTDPALFGGVFAAPTFWTWRTVAKLIDGIPLTEPREIELFRECTGVVYSANRHGRRPARRLFLLIGRRGGKDRFLSAVAVWRAALCADWKQHTSAGEGAVVVLLGADRRQAAILSRYCSGLLAAPLLAPEVARSTNEAIEFRNGSSLEISTNDARLVRGRSAIAVLGSECCYWKTEEHSSSSDEEVVGAAEPSLSMCPDQGVLLLGSSVYRRRGYMHRKFKELHGNDEADDICWLAPSRTMNPRLPQSVIDKALAEDGPKARAEFLSIWREDISDFIPADIIEGATDRGIVERPRSGTSPISGLPIPPAGRAVTAFRSPLPTARSILRDEGTTARCSMCSARENRASTAACRIAPGLERIRIVLKLANLKLAAEPPRNPARQQLAAAIGARSAAEEALAAAKRAVVRGEDAVTRAAVKLDAANEALVAAGEQHAKALAESIAADGPPARSTAHAARSAVTEAEDGYRYARAALAELQKRVGDAEDAERAARHAVIALADAVVRSAAKRTLADAADAALRLQKARMTLRFLKSPELAGRPLVIGVQRPAFGEEWADAVRAFGQERADRRAGADRSARELRDKGFAGEVEQAIERHLEFALGAIHRADQGWSTSPELAPWQAARQRLIEGDADAELPS